MLRAIKETVCRLWRYTSSVTATAVTPSPRGEGIKTAKGGRERDVDSIMQERQLTNFWKYDGDEQTPVSREDIIRQIH